MNLTNFRVYSQTCVQRSPLGNGKVTVIYRVTPYTGPLYRGLTISSKALFLFWLNFATGIDVGQLSFEDSSVPSFFLCVTNYLVNVLDHSVVFHPSHALIPPYTSYLVHCLSVFFISRFQLKL